MGKEARAKTAVVESAVESISVGKELEWVFDGVHAHADTLRAAKQVQW